MFKKIALLLVVPLSLTGCFGTEPQATESWQHQEFSSFTLDVPPHWARVDKSKLSTAVPETVVALYVGEKVKGETKSLNVAKETLNTQATSYDYARANVALIERTLLDYRSGVKEDREINGQKTIFHTYLARNSISDNLLFFVQAYFSKDSTGYLVTCGVPDDALDSDKATCEQAIMSFRLK